MWFREQKQLVLESQLWAVSSKRESTVLPGTLSSGTTQKRGAWETLGFCNTDKAADVRWLTVYGIHFFLK
jgi:hypothetical protein